MKTVNYRLHSKLLHLAQERQSDRAILLDRYHSRCLKPRSDRKVVYIYPVPPGRA